MPIKKAALKAMRAGKKQHERNTRITNDLKTRIKSIKKFISDNKKDEARSLFPTIASRLDKAVRKKILHKNKASRTISRLEKALNKLGTA